MAYGKLFNLFALSSLAVLVCNLGVTPANALALEGHNMAKMKRVHGHEGVAKRKRDQSQRCKPRSTSSAPPTTSTPAATSTPDTTWSLTLPSSTWIPISSSTWTPPTSTSSTPAATSSTSSSSGSGGKLGLGWANGNDGTINNFVSSNTKYIYTWSEQCPSEAKSLGLECMPMLWGSAQDKLDAFKSTVVAGYANYALGFNEVNEAGQANMDVGTAVSLWWQYLEPLVSEGYQLIAPVTSSNPNGFDWMVQFMNQCNGCHISGIPVHYYGTSGQGMIDYIEKWYNQFKLPIWVTEYACQNYNTAYENNGRQCDENQVWEFHSTVTKYMDGNSNVVAYMPFGFMRDMQGVNTLNQLMTSDGWPTSLGSTYLQNSFT